MRREEKYPDTSSFTFYNANPKNRITGDCVVRAIATATGIPYNEVVKGMTDIYLKTGYVWNDKKGIEAYMKSIGWVKHQQPRKKDGTKYTGKEWSDYLYTLFDSWVDGEKTMHDMVVNIGGHHTTAFIDGRCMDIWDCTDKCVGNYWTRGRGGKKMVFHRMKEIATYLMEVALDTGYSYEFLCDRVEELVEDGQNYNSAATEVGAIAYELDY